MMNAGRFGRPDQVQYGIFCRARLFIEGSLEVKLPTVWTDAARVLRAVREEKESEEIQLQLHHATPHYTTLRHTTHHYTTLP